MKTIIQEMQALKVEKKRIQQQIEITSHLFEQAIKDTVQEEIDNKISKREFTSLVLDLKGILYSSDTTECTINLLRDRAIKTKELENVLVSLERNKRDICSKLFHEGVLNKYVLRTKDCSKASIKRESLK